jgi:DNA-binding XRE family transcriptional regulator
LFAIDFLLKIAKIFRKHSKYRVAPILYHALFLESREMEPETEKILENLRNSRISKKISLLNLANMVEISHSHLYYIESKKVIPSIDVIIKLTKALNMSLKNLFDNN